MLRPPPLQDEEAELRAACQCSSKVQQPQRPVPTSTGRLFCVNDLQRPSCFSMVGRRSPVASGDKWSTPGGASMTTVDVRIVRVGSGDRLYLHNGMSGPATSVLHAFGRACQDGMIPSSKWNIAEITKSRPEPSCARPWMASPIGTGSSRGTAPTRNESRLSGIGCSTAQSTKFTPSRSNAPGQRREPGRHPRLSRG